MHICLLVVPRPVGSGSESSDSVITFETKAGVTGRSSGSSENPIIYTDDRCHWPLTSCWGAGKPCNSGHQSRERPVRSAAMFSMRLEPGNSVLPKIVPRYHTTWKLFILTKNSLHMGSRTSAGERKLIDKQVYGFDSIESEARNMWHAPTST